jgi:hypothetical protein
MATKIVAETIRKKERNLTARTEMDDKPKWNKVNVG